MRTRIDSDRRTRRTEAVGYSEKAIREFLENLRNRENGTGAENPVSSENDGLVEREISLTVAP